MKKRKKFYFLFIILIVVFSTTLFSAIDSTVKKAVSELTGGVIVHVGSTDSKETSALHSKDGYIVQGLTTSSKDAAGMMKDYTSRGLTGKVSAKLFNGKTLPYIDNMVNILIVDNKYSLSRDEMMRVISPGGLLFLNDKGKWSSTKKAWDKDMDEWTHYLHDPEGTMTSHDKLVGLPRRLQWVSSPKWLRNHDFMSSLTALVSAKGKIFYIIDEGLRNHIYLPTRWTLVARDAFNGTLLWKRRIDSWFPHNYPFKSGPGYQPRRLVAVDDKVYVTLGLNVPLTALDANTGKTIKTYKETEPTEEIILSNGVLFLVTSPGKENLIYTHKEPNRGSERNRVNNEFGWLKERAPRVMMAVDSSSGKVLWKYRSKAAPMTLAVDKKQAYFYNGDTIICLDRKTGKKKWESENVGDWNKIPVNHGAGYTPRLFVSGERVVFSIKGPTKQNRLTGLSTETGKIIWQNEQPSSGHYSPEDVFLIGGLVWTPSAGGGSSKTGVQYQAVAIKTGEIKKEFYGDHIKNFFMHQRCYPGRATDRFIMTSGTGTEFLNVETQECQIHHWLRGSCIYGIMPANGLFYKTPDSCACYYQSKIPYFMAMATKETRREIKPDKDDVRLIKGPAYKQSTKSKQNKSEWPVYRGDNQRSGYSETTVSSDIKKKWEAKIGGKLSTLTIADEKVFVSAIEKNIVYALDGNTGKVVWKYTANGRVDSPPAIFQGKVVFGSVDGHVYCLKVDDGKLIWTFQAAPEKTQIISYEQMESAWPISGSVLVHEGVVFCLAGRSVFVDGGMRLLRLDVNTGRKLSETIMDDKVPGTKDNLQTLIAGKSMPVANPDLLSYDGKNIYMSAQKFDLKGKRVELEVKKGKESHQLGEGMHLFCPTGFLDEVWFHRSFWIYGRNAGEGHGEYSVPRSYTLTGRIIVFDKENVYSFFAENVGNNIYPRTSYTIYAANKKDFVVQIPDKKGKENTDNPKKVQKKKKKPKKVKNTGRLPKYNIKRLWEVESPGLLANAMVLAGGNLFLAGPPDVADEEQETLFGILPGADDERNKKLKEQEKAWLDQFGAQLVVLSAKDGKKLSEYKIDSIPVWDGMAAASGKLFISQKNGSVTCWSKKLESN